MCELFDQYTRKGINEGIKEGIKEGIQAGVEALIITCKELGASFEETSEKVKLRFQLGESEVNHNMSLYW